jgi:iron(II)-dependent oxidoreductase
VPDLPDLGVAAHYAGRFEVTAAELEEFAADGAYTRRALWDDAGWAAAADALSARRGQVASARRGLATSARRDLAADDDAGLGERPARGVTIHEARAFARWRGLRLGGNWRLPSEDEWRVGAGWDPAAGRLRVYPWGDTFQDGAATIAAPAPSRVGSMRGDLSPLGLFDAGGNVLEWVERPGERPGTKGAAFGATVDGARRYAQVQSTGDAGPAPPPELLEWIGFRLVRDLGEELE